MVQKGWLWRHKNNSVIFLGLKILGLSFFWVDKKSVQMSIPILDFIECPPPWAKDKGSESESFVPRVFLQSLNDQSFTLSDLGDLKHSMPGGGADSAPLFISVVA